MSLDLRGFTALTGTDDITLKAWGNAAFDTAELLPKLAALDTETPPAGAFAADAYADLKWGRWVFPAGSLCAKALYTCRHLDRAQPFAYISALIDNWRRASELGLPSPAFKGIFSVFADEGYLWNGVLSEYLDGWRNLAPENDGDYALMAAAIGAFAEKGVCNADMHFANVMTDGDGNWRVVDLDRLAFGVSESEARSQMAEKCASLLPDDESREKLAAALEAAGLA